MGSTASGAILHRRARATLPIINPPLSPISSLYFIACGCAISEAQLERKACPAAHRIPTPSALLQKKTSRTLQISIVLCDELYRRGRRLIAWVKSWRVGGKYVRLDRFDAVRCGRTRYPVASQLGYMAGTLICALGSTIFAPAMVFSTWCPVS